MRIWLRHAEVLEWGCRQENTAWKCSGVGLGHRSTEMFCAYKNQVEQAGLGGIFLVFIRNVGLQSQALVHKGILGHEGIFSFNRKVKDAPVERSSTVGPSCSSCSQDSAPGRIWASLPANSIFLPSMGQHIPIVPSLTPRPHPSMSISTNNSN